jgi:hypothetical protein
MLTFYPLPLGLWGQKGELFPTTLFGLALGPSLLKSVSLEVQFERPNGKMMLQDDNGIPKEIKPVKAARGFGQDEQKEQQQCACIKGGTCYRSKHAEGTSCERMVTLSKSNRHKTCNGCRKNKQQKNLRDGSGMDNSRAVTVPSIIQSTDGSSNYLAVPMPLPPQHQDMTSAIPSMLGVGVGSQVSHSASGDGHKESAQCICMKGGQCHREKHSEGIQCERYVSLTKTNRHKMCNGCRKAKAKKPERSADRDNTQFMSVPLNNHDLPSVMVHHGVDLRLGHI